MRNITLILLTIFNSSLEGQNFIATYNFSDVTTGTGLIDPTEPPIVENLVLDHFRASNPNSNPGASGRFSFSGWPVGATDGTDAYWQFTSALSPFTYYEVGIRIAPNHTLELKSISFYVRRSGTGIRNYCVRSTIDNYGSNIAASTGTNSKLEVLPEEVFFWKYDSISTATDQRGNTLVLGKEFSELTDTIAFRFYAWNSEATGGTFSIDNVTFSGYVKDTSFFAGLTASQKIPGLKVIPNPTNGETVNIRSQEEISSLEVVDLTGRVLISGVPKATEETIDISTLVPALYVIRIRCNNNIATVKLVVTGKW